MKDKTGFVSGDELLASLSATPQEIASAMDWLSSLHIRDSEQVRQERRAAMIATGMTVEAA